MIAGASVGRVKRIAVAMSVLALLAVSCQAETAANARAECGSDANCLLGAWTVDCCPRCKPFSAPISQVNAMDEKCRAMSAASARCPELQCAPHEGPDFIAKCVAGQCVVRP